MPLWSTGTNKPKPPNRSAGATPKPQAVCNKTAPTPPRALPPVLANYDDTGHNETIATQAGWRKVLPTDRPSNAMQATKALAADSLNKGPAACTCTLFRA